MSKNTLLQRAIRLALANAAAASVALPVAALAADATGPAAPADQAAAPAPTTTQPALQEVVVTGSRIIQPGLKSISPVTAISAKDIASQGTTSVEDILNNLPQVMANQNAMASNGASGTATVDLRGLGPQRTLVLINGRRLMPGDPDNAAVRAGAADLNNIPIALVERVDVLTGGASAVYGADAVSGVVNFVMNDHFQGFEINANAAGNWHNQHSWFGTTTTAAGFGSAPGTVLDGVSKDVTFLMGSNFADGKGNAVAYVTYRRQNALLEAARDFSRCTLNGGKCSGSGTDAFGSFYSAGFATSNPSGPAFFPNGVLAVHGGQLVPRTDSDLFNYGALNYYQRPDERWNAGSFVHYDIDDNHQVYSEFMFMNDETDAQIAPSGSFIGSGTGTNPTTGQPDGNWTINCNNPYLSAQEATTLGCLSNSTSLSNTQTVQSIFGRRNIEGGNRSDFLTHTSYRFVIGSQGQITDNLSYNVYAQEGRTLRSEEYLNDVSKTRLSAALLAVVDPKTGNIVCAANANGGGGAPGCVPYNIWGTGSGVSPGSVSYFSVPGLIEGSTEERVYHADFTSDMTNYVKLPSANEGLGLNFGVEYRQEFETLKPDLEFITGDLAGQGSPTLPLNAGYGVKEGFIEGRLPLVQDKPFAKEVSVDLGYRYSKYDVGYTTNTYKFEADWSPTSSLRIRGGYNRAVRAPNISELFAEQFVGLDGSADPCATSFGSPATQTATNCTRSGLSTQQYGKIGTPGNPAGQYNGLLGGNPKLKPEIADTYTFGLVFTPTFLPSFNATIDVFNIKIKDLISSYGANLIVTQCVADDNPTFCSMVHRDSAGSLWFSNAGYVVDPILNLGYEKTDGVDISANYTQSIGGLGSLNFGLIGTYTASFITEPYPGSGDYNCAGYFGGTCGNPLPHWRHTMTVGWATPWRGLGLEARWRHLSNTEDDVANPSPLLAGRVNKAYQYTGTRDYLDVIGTDQIWSGVQLQIGINNVFDKDPPILPTSTVSSVFFNGNTYPGVYDTLGRYVFMNLKLDF
jgi:iron complex outermembrane receptor protein